MEKYLEYNDGSSHKFWHISVAESSHTVNYGRIGTEGQFKTKQFDSPEAALKDGEKLLNSKIKKGYKETEKRSGKYRKVYLTYDEQDDEGVDLVKKLEKLVTSGDSKEISFLSIGAWAEPWDIGCDDVVAYLADHKDDFPKVTGLFIGDMTFEECEISWIILCDLAPLLAAYPNLEEFYIRGSSSLELRGLNHANLKKLVIECGGLPKKVLDQIASAKLPNLEHLELYLGDDYYGFDGALSDIEPFLEKKRFPKLTYLGLSDSVIADDIAELAAKSDILDQLDVLDLSKGTLGDRGAKALLHSEKIKSLKKLDLHRHYMSDKMMEKFKALKEVEVDLSNPEGDAPEDDRYVEVSE